MLFLTIPIPATYFKSFYNLETLYLAISNPFEYLLPSATMFYTPMQEICELKRILPNLKFHQYKYVLFLIQYFSNRNFNMLWLCIKNNQKTGQGETL